MEKLNNMTRAKGIGKYNKSVLLTVCREGREFARRAGPFISPFKCFGLGSEIRGTMTFKGLVIIYDWGGGQRENGGVTKKLGMTGVG